MALYYNAWFELDYERDRAKLDPIKRSSCFDYASDYDFDAEQADDLWFYIGRMDREFLKYWKTKIPQTKPGKPRQRTVKRGNAEDPS